MSDLRDEVKGFISSCERIHGVLGGGHTLTSDERGLIIASAFELIRALLRDGTELTDDERRIAEELTIEC